MPGGKKSKQNSKKNSQFKEDSGMVVYRGPAMPPQQEGGLRLNVRMTAVTSVTSSGAGVISGLFSAIPSSATEWSSYSSRFTLYRLLAFRITLIPAYKVNTTTVNMGVVVLSTDKSGSLATPASLAAAYALALAKVYGPCQTIKYTTKMSEIEDAQYLPTSAPATAWKVPYYGQGFSNTTLVYYVLLEYNVELKSQD